MHCQIAKLPSHLTIRSKQVVAIYAQLHHLSYTQLSYFVSSLLYYRSLRRILFALAKVGLI
jgi:hypothetical protein